jgi:micrococcal nuclease
MEGLKTFVLVGCVSLVAFVCGYGWGFREGRSVPGAEQSAPAAPPIPEKIAVPEPVRTQPREAPVLHRYPVEKVLRVVDGDTFDVRFAIWEDIVLVKRLRLLGVDTPELRPRSGTEAEREAEKEAARAARAYVEETLTSAAAVFVVTDWKSDSFGRVLAGVRYVDESGTEYDLAAKLLESGHAEPYEK